MSVERGVVQLGVAEQDLDDANVHAILEQPFASSSTTPLTGRISLAS